MRNLKENPPLPVLPTTVAAGTAGRANKREKAEKTADRGEDSKKVALGTESETAVSPVKAENVDAVKVEGTGEGTDATPAAKKKRGGGRKKATPAADSAESGALPADTSAADLQTDMDTSALTAEGADEQLATAGDMSSTPPAKKKRTRRSKADLLAAAAAIAAQKAQKSRASVAASDYTGGDDDANYSGALAAGNGAAVGGVNPYASNRKTLSRSAVPPLDVLKALFVELEAAGLRIYAPEEAMHSMRVSLLPEGADSAAMDVDSEPEPVAAVPSTLLGVVSAGQSAAEAADDSTAVVEFKPANISRAASTVRHHVHSPPFT